MGECRRRRQGCQRRSRGKRAMAVLLGGAIAMALVLALRLAAAAAGPVDAVLVLGGSIRREMHAVEVVARSPSLPVLISHGSPAPCVRALFERAGVAVDGVWLEDCAESTFDNFFYGLPILRDWRVRRVRLVTSPSHLPRALWVGRLMLGVTGIWVDLDAVAESGRPGNRESLWKTGLDVGRAALWGLVGGLVTPRCDRVYPLGSVDLDLACQTGFKCEHQGGLRGYCDRR